jgi:hypothetical protein
LTKAYSASFVGVKTQKQTVSIKVSAQMKGARGKPTPMTITVGLAIWHSPDKKLAPFASTLIDVLTLPLQDARGREFVAELKKRIAFPLRVELSLADERAKDSTPPRLVTQINAIRPAALQKSELAWPPDGVSATSEPFVIQPTTIHATEEELGELPAEPGVPNEK